MAARWEGVRRMVKKGEGIKKYKLVVTEWAWGCKYSTGNGVAEEHTCMTHGHGQWCGGW